MSNPQELSKRERQIMDALYQMGEATVSEVLERIPDPPSYSAVRATLRVLEEKGHVQHKQDGPRYVYLPTVPQDTAQTAALSHLLGTFFGGSVEAAVMALVQLNETKLSQSELERLASRIREAEREGR
ncbi:MAG TPA: BlaI/MecI/CopY family transcriptional regulator [Longimicrobiales bacterium]|nr:BlaI/MecI/CopY family transcriptional regulator [Longimicrobiales bacterium]